MIKSSSWPLQKAIFSRLNTDTALKNVVTGVYDYVPREEEAGYKVEKPYCTIGEQTTRPFDTKTTVGENITLVLHCWSKFPGKEEAYKINDLMLQALTKSPLSIEGGFSLQDFRRESGTTVIQDVDGKTYHGILRVRAIINN